jgi:bacterioferritin-associated ferredoxin
MYVCVCKAVSDKRIERSVAQGVVTLKQLRDHTGLGSCCGKCVPEARRSLSDALARQSVRVVHQMPVAAAA